LLIILIISGFIYNVIIIIFTLYRNFEDPKNVNSLNLLTDDQHNLNNLIQRFTNNIKTMQKYYFIIVIAFTFSYFVDIYFQFFKTLNITELPNDNLNSTITAIIYPYSNNSTFNNNFTITIENAEKSCYRYNNLGNNFFIVEFFICTISFFIRELTPHLYIFLALFKYKPNINSRSSSFIELI